MKSAGQIQNVGKKKITVCPTCFDYDQYKKSKKVRMEFIGGLLIPVVLLSIPRTRHSVFWVTIASILVVYGMYVKRIIIVLPTVASPVFSETWLTYNPTWVETGVTIAGFTGFFLMYMVFSKLFPIIAIYEIHEYEEDIKKAEQMEVLYDKSRGSVSVGD